MNPENIHSITDLIGRVPYRMAFAGGWIDQPFVSRHNPSPPGSMVVVGLEPTCRFMDRCGMATSTRKAAMKLWGDTLPDRDPAELVKEIYNEENKDTDEPSGAQDMVGLVYPGVSRIDFDLQHEGGYFPCNVTSNRDPDIAAWLEKVIHMVPVNQRPPGYNPLGDENLDPAWIERLSQSGKDCYDAICAKDAKALGASMNECMQCWETILPHTVKHPELNVDLLALLAYYQKHYDGAMYSGCGGGYLYVVSESHVPGSLDVKVRI